jgi:hypothetical protein
MSKISPRLIILISAFSFLISAAHSQNNLYVNTEFAYSAGLGNLRVEDGIIAANSSRSFAGKVALGHRFARGIGLGGLLMLDFYEDVNYLMLGPEIRFQIGKSGDFIPFVSGSAGYSVEISQTDREGGFFYYPSAGLLISLRGEQQLVLSAGYKRQFYTDVGTFDLIIDGQSVMMENERAYNYGFLTFSVGISF